MADIGAGTGFLGFLAARLGAKRVDLYEAAEIADVARKLMRHNKLANCRLAQVPLDGRGLRRSGWTSWCPRRSATIPSRRTSSPPSTTRTRASSSPAVAIIPHSVEQFVCPVTAERLYRELAAWDEVGYGLNFAPAKAMSLNNIYVRWLEPGRSAGGSRGGRSVGQGDLRPPQQDDTRGRSSLARRQAGHGLRRGAVVVGGAGSRRPALHRAAGAAHALGAALSARALADRRRRGADLSVRLRSTTSDEKGTNVTWTLTLSDAAGREVLRQALDLEKGYLP